jgi:hypothetical protein
LRLLIPLPRILDWCEQPDALNECPDDSQRPNLPSEIPPPPYGHAQLAASLNAILAERKLTQTEAAQVLRAVWFMEGASIFS